MNFKDFLKPTKKKAIVFAILLIILIMIGTMFQSIGGWTKHTDYLPLPLPALTIKTVYCPEYLAYSVPDCQPGSSLLLGWFNILFLIADLLFWYLVSCISIFTYKKVMKK